MVECTPYILSSALTLKEEPVHVGLQAQVSSTSNQHIRLPASPEPAGGIKRSNTSWVGPLQNACATHMIRLRDGTIKSNQAWVLSN